MGKTHDQTDGVEHGQPQPQSLRTLFKRLDEISASVPDEEWAALPRDLSKNLDHYLYGSPKEDE